MPREPLGTPAPIMDVTLDSRRLGEASVTLDDDFLVVSPVSGAVGTSVRWRLDLIASVSRAADRVTIAHVNGMVLSASIETTSRIDEIVRDAARAIPELTRGLRWMGSSRGDRVDVSAHQEEPRFFAPLLEARKAGASARSPLEALWAFDGERLAGQVDALLAAMAEERHPEHAARRRALEAELLEIVDPLRGELQHLSELAAAARANVNDLALWRAWSRQVAHVFESGDRVWPALRRALATRWHPAPPQPQTIFLGRPRPGGRGGAHGGSGS